MHSLEFSPVWRYFVARDRDSKAEGQVYGTTLRNGEEGVRIYLSEYWWEREVLVGKMI